jgi:hypothetical protein
MKLIKPLLSAALLISALFSGQILFGQQIQWLPFPIDTSLPGDPFLGPNPTGSNPDGTWIVTNLACYGNVLVTQTFPGQPTDFINPDLQNVPNPNVTFINGRPSSSFSWGPLGELNTVNNLSPTPVTYTISFYFLDGQPNFNGVVLMSAGLAEDTTAAVSQPIAFLGEFDLLGSAHTCLTNHLYNPLVTTGRTNVGTVGNIIGSYFNTDNVGDNFNTGMGLFRPTGALQTTMLPTGSTGFPTSSSPVPYLTLNVSQQAGDGVGFNIGYICSTNACTNNCITIATPLNIFASTCSNCAVVTYQAQVTDVCCSNTSVFYLPPSGTCFPPGTTTVQVIATDSCGNSNTCSFKVMVFQDTNRPIILSRPTGITNCFPSGCGPMPDVTDQIEAAGSVPGASVSITQSIPPGTIICSNTTITFTVTSACGQSTNVTVPVILSDNCCLQISCPEDIEVTSCSNSMPVSFTVLYQDNCCSNCQPILVSTPPSGYNFPLGITTVTNVVTDAAGNSNSCTFRVAVIQDPNCTNCLGILCPSNIVASTCTSNTPVFFTVDFFDTCCSNCTATLISTPPSGYSFPLGSTIVTNIVTDPFGHSNYCLFSVTVVQGTNCAPCLPPVFGCVKPSVEFVPNGDFESFSSCPTAVSQLSVATPWFPAYGTPDYENSCAPFSSGVSTPANQFGSVVPHSGNAYAGGYMYSGGAGADEFMEVPLNFTLQPNVTYGVSFYVSLAGIDDFAINSIGAYFSTGPWVVGTYVPPVQSPSSVFLDSVGSWMHVTGTYTSIIGGENYLTIGNFRGDGQTATKLVGNPFGSAFVYYYLDDVSVTNVCGCSADKTVESTTAWSFDTPTAYDPNTGLSVNVSVLSTVTNGNCPLNITQTWVATNSCGTNVCSQTVTVLPAPQILATNIVIVSCVPTNVFYNPSATDSCCGNVLVGCNPPSGSIFNPGRHGTSTTTVYCTATNCFGVITTTSFTVKLVNSLVTQTNIVVTSCTNLPVDYTPIVEDCCGNSNLTLLPLSGSTFNVGTTTPVTWTLTDSCGTKTGTFTVTVLQDTNCNPCSPPIFGCVSPPVDLVPNGDLESYSSCPATYSQITLATPWFQPTQGTPDYFNTCAPASSGVSVPNNFIGSATPHSGNGYAGFFAYGANPGGSSVREYMEVPLASPLVAGQTYQVSFYVSLADCYYAIDNLGAYFSVGKVQNPLIWDTLPLVPQVRNTPGVFLNSIGSWTLVSGTFTAAGGESYLTIGNFSDDANTLSTLSGLPELGSVFGSYYYIDDISVSNTCGCPTNKTVYSNLPWSFDTPTAYDPNTASSAYVTVLSIVTNGPCPLTITETWIATNSCGTNTCSQTVTVIDPPQILCANISVASCVPIQVFYSPLATNSCCPTILASCDPPSGSIFDPGITTVTCVATNCFGAVAFSNFTVTVTSPPPPALPVQTNIVVTSCTNLPVFYSNLIFTNNACCSNWLIGYSQPSGSTFVVGTVTTVTYAIGSTCLGTNFESFTVTVLPGTNCTNCVQIQYPTNIVAMTCSNCAVVNFAVTATNRCCPGVVPLTFSPLLPGSCFPIGTTIEVVTATDICHNNTITVSFPVTVQPGTNCTNCVVLKCPTNISVTTCSNCAIVNFKATATNICCPAIVPLSYSPFQPGTCFPVGTTVEQVTGTDLCHGTTASCFFTVTVTQSNCPPIISLGPTNIILCAGASGCVPMPDEVHPTPTFYILKNTGVSSNLSASATLALPQSTLDDPHWTLVSVPTLPTNSPLEFGTNTQLQINSLPQWLNPDPLAAWIAPANDASNNAPEGDYDYQTTFVLPADGTFTISAQVSADDYVSDVMVNGGSLGLTTPATNGNSSAQWNPITITGQGFAGTNTLDFIVHNNPTIGSNPPADNTDSPSGLLVEFNAISQYGNDLPIPLYNPAAVQATNCDGTPAPGWQSIPPGTIICSNTTITFVFTNECGDTTSYTAAVIVENCCVKPPKNMALWFTFDESIGNTCLNSAAGNVGTRYEGNVIANSGNGPSHNIGQYVNNSLCFDGAGDKVLEADYTAIDFATNFSADAWVRWNGGGGSFQVLVDHRTQSGPNIFGYEWFLQNGRPGLQLATGTSTPANFVSPTPIPVGVWTHLAVTVQRNSATGVKFYVNGLTGAPNIFSDTAVAGSTGKPTSYITVGDLNPVFHAQAPFNGCMDELELFSRALLPYEVYDIYGAFHAGKCRPTASVPPVTTVCLGSKTVTIQVQVCNTGSTTETLNVSFAGLSAAQAGGPPAVNGPAPGQFSGYPNTVTLPPNSCSNFLVTIQLPPGLNLTTVAYYQMTIKDPFSSQSFSSIGALREVETFWCDHRVLVQNLTNLVISTGPVNFGFVVNNPTNVPYPLNASVLVVDGDLNLETNVVSLNGLAPGTPVTNQFVLPANGSMPVTVSVSYLDSQPSTPYYLLLYLNISYDAVPIPVASAGFVQSIPPTVGPPVSASYTNGQATLTWDAINTGWTLLSNTNIAGTNWIPVNLPVLPQPDGSQGVTLPATGKAQFFQLVKPVPP